MENKTKNFSLKLALNLFIEFGPIVLFFIIFNLVDFVNATIALVVVVLIAFLLSTYVEKRIAIFSLFSSGLIIIFGGVTVFSSNPTYLIFKDTLFWGLLFLIILGYYLKGVLILKKLFISIFDITDNGWRIVSIRWMVFAFLLAFSNQLALWYFTTEQWVNYKMVTLLAFILFSMWQFLLSRKERNPNANSWGMKI
ncbi:MAG: septation protein IspZ [Candidatus Vogelbacteria bacterium]|nr:septation protein IspZ [Candidatus Vogelbacteria bacterium]